MKKKILYGIFLLSIFLLSTASMVTPVRGYEFGVPSEAVGVTTNGEIKIFDEDEVDDHLGSGVSLSGLHGGDCDVVGAQSQTKYTGIEKNEEIDYLNDYVVKPAGIDVSVDEVRALLQSMADVNGTYGGLLPPGSAYGPYGPLGWLANWTLEQAILAGYAQLATVLVPGTPAAGGQTGESSLAQIELFLATPAYATLAGLYSKDYDGVILDRETWEYEENPDEIDDSKPDDDDDPAPFFADPRDWNDVAENLQAMRYAIDSEIDSIQVHWGYQGTGPYASGAGWYAATVLTCAAVPGGPDPVSNTWFGDGYGAIPSAGELYEYLNWTIKNQIDTWKLPAASKAYLLSKMNNPNNLTSKGAPNAYITDWVAGLYGFVDVVLETIYATFEAQVPDKAGFFLGQLTAGQPAMTPSDDFMKKVIKEYNLDDDAETLYDMYGYEVGKDLNLDGEISGAPVGSVSRNTGVALGGETIYPQAYMDIHWDSTTAAVIVEVEWPDGMIDPDDNAAFGGDNEDELDDFEIAFPYGDTGGQGTVSYMDGDDIFWQLGSVESIPGFEITIILGASAVAILGLIYVVMKKRKM